MNEDLIIFIGDVLVESDRVYGRVQDLVELKKIIKSTHDFMLTSGCPVEMIIYRNRSPVGVGLTIGFEYSSLRTFSINIDDKETNGKIYFDLVGYFYDKPVVGLSDLDKVLVLSTCFGVEVIELRVMATFDKALEDVLGILTYGYLLDSYYEWSNVNGGSSWLLSNINLFNKTSTNLTLKKGLSIDEINKFIKKLNSTWGVDVFEMTYVEYLENVYNCKQKDDLGLNSFSDYLKGD